MNTFRTIIVNASGVAASRGLAERWSGGVGMYLTPLTANGNTATHYISSGYAASEVFDKLPYSEWSQDEEGNWVETAYEGDLQGLIDDLTPEGEEPDLTVGQLQQIANTADISTQKPRAALRRLGLEFLEVDEP